MSVRKVLLVSSLVACMVASVAYAAPVTAWEQDAATQKEALEMNHKYDVEHGFVSADKIPSKPEKQPKKPDKPNRHLGDVPSVIKPEKEPDEVKPQWEVKWEESQLIQKEGLEHNRQIDEKTPDRRFQRVR